MDGLEVGIGAMGVGAGVLTQAASVAYESAALLPFAHALLGLGGAVFAKGAVGRLPWALLALLAAGAGGLVASVGVLLLDARGSPMGFALAIASLAWTFALAATGLYRQAVPGIAGPGAPTGPSDPGRQTFK